MIDDRHNLDIRQAGGTVYALAASPDFQQDGICFAASDSGIYRSSDSGYNWDIAYSFGEGHQPLAVTALAVSPSFLQDRTIFAAVKGGILRSSNDGETWYTTVLPSPPPLVSALAVSLNFEQDGIVLASTLEDGVYSSTDRGVNWTPWNFGLIDLNVLSIAISPEFARDETVWVGTESGIFRSTNGGRAWRATQFPMEYDPVLSLMIVHDVAQDCNMIFAGIQTYGLWLSIDQGLNWTRIGAEIIIDSVNDLKIIDKPDSSPSLLALVESSVLISYDFGQSWARLTRTEHIATTLLAPSRTENLLMIGLFDKGIMRFSDL